MKSLTTLSLVALFALLAVAPAQADDHNNYWRHNGNGHGNKGFDHENRFYDYGNNGFRNNVYRNNDYVSNNYVNNNGNGSGYGFGNSNRGYGNIDSTQARLQARIESGITSGRSSARESAHLQAKLSQVANIEVQMRASGNILNPREHSRLSNMLSKLNNDITRELNDFEHRQIGYRNGWNNWR